MEYDEDVSHKSWKDKLGCILHNKLFHAFVVVLIVLDALIILMLLLVDLNVIPVPGETEEAKAKNHKNVENGLHYFGFSLICFFVIEIALRIIVDGAEFFKDKLNPLIYVYGRT
ncbi:voltage-gated hydrogen channel 1-like isoform X2 [Mytilus galloprovincialis]|uniref:voltage-gated hydrogen channel 1-like isoform X2 n=1 Tax=Mytilus galloprovincialis TaxID=29158 RepID=UPI003F7B7C32